MSILHLYSRQISQFYGDSGIQGEKIMFDYSVPNPCEDREPSNGIADGGSNGIADHDLEPPEAPARRVDGLYHVEMCGGLSSPFTDVCGLYDHLTASAETQLLHKISLQQKLGTFRISHMMYPQLKTRQ